MTTLFSEEAEAAGFFSSLQHYLHRKSIKIYIETDAKNFINTFNFEY